MANLKLRYLTTLILLALTAAAVNGLKYESSQDNEEVLTNLQATIPLKIGESWNGQDYPLDERIYDILDTRAIIHRSFKGKNRNNVFLSVVHYSDTKVDFHAPEQCLGGRGIEALTNNKSLLLQFDGKEKTLNVAEIVTQKTASQTLSYYFYKSGDFAGNNYIKMRLSIAANKFFRNDAKGSLIRVSTNISTNKKEAELLLTKFLKDLFPHISQTL